MRLRLCCFSFNYMVTDQLIWHEKTFPTWTALSQLTSKFAQNELSIMFGNEKTGKKETQGIKNLQEAFFLDVIP